jgi:hypothetical protein
MPPSLTLTIGLAVSGIALLAAGRMLIRRSGARLRMGRRLAGARQLRVGDLLALAPTDPLPPRPVRVTGRIRCAEPIVTRAEDRLVALHRDVEVAAPGGGWRSIERLRETRSFELWDHIGSLQVDPAQAAEPLVVLPHVWTGGVDELDEAYAPALARVTAEQGSPGVARAVTRMVSVVDRLLLLAVAARDGEGRVVLAPPRGGYILSNLDLDDAMRVLGGPHPRWMLAGVAAVAVAVILLAAAGLMGAASLATA